MLRCAALEVQRSGRDLAQLEELVDEVVWTASSDAIDVAEPLIVSGLWLSENAQYGQTMLSGRSEAGGVTLLVPRFKGGNLAPLVSAPSAVEVRAGNFDGVAWEDGEQYVVSGVSSLRTMLHAGRWALATGVGVVVLCFRPHITAGPIVMCTAALGSRPPGVELEEQRRLLSRILRETSAHVRPPSPKQGDTRTNEPALDLDTYLSEEGAQGAGLLLALVACKGDRAADVAKVAKELLGIELPESEAGRALRRVPDSSTQAIVTALRASGWGAHLRRVEQAIAPKETA